MSKSITYGTIVPLIGGENIGIMNALGGQLPEWVLSYKAFSANDSHFIHYLRQKGYTGDYIHLDEAPSYIPKKVDVVNTVCPCAGLSSLSTSSKSSAAANDWMYRTASYVLGQVRPRVFWGENAPRLFSEGGKEVVSKLFKIGQEFGYSLNLYFTESRLHGLSQKRPRTFYFFTNSATAPIFPWYRKPQESIDKILKQPLRKEDPMAVLANPASVYSDPWLQYHFAATGTKTIAELHGAHTKTENLIVYSDGGYGKSLLQVAEWMDANGFAKTASRARAMQAKRDLGKGYWAHGITLPKGTEIPALIGAMPYTLLNPFRDNWITVRDSLRIMKMPDDFNLVSEPQTLIQKVNHICQNVPASTAEDMMRNVMLYLDGSLKSSGCQLLRQNNKSLWFDESTPEPLLNTATLGPFFDLQTSGAVV